MPDGCLDVLIVQSTLCPSKNDKGNEDIKRNRRNNSCSNGDRNNESFGPRAELTDSVLASTEPNACDRSIRLTDWDYRARLVHQFEGKKTIGFRLRPGVTQAHMTREFVQWFAVTPSRLRRNPDLLNVICQPGLGNWTTEQISIK